MGHQVQIELTKNGPLALHANSFNMENTQIYRYLLSFGILFVWHKVRNMGFSLRIKLNNYGLLA